MSRRQNIDRLKALSMSLKETKPEPKPKKAEIKDLKVEEPKEDAAHKMSRKERRKLAKSEETSLEESSEEQAD
jgi:septal ring factor EnvC (AmiA/AmiB activator)